MSILPLIPFYFWQAL